MPGHVLPNVTSLFDTLEHSYDTMLVDFNSSFEEFYNQSNFLDGILTEKYSEILDELGMRTSLDDLIELDRNRELHTITSVVGDDEYTTTDSIALGPAIIGFGPVINGIKLSLKDAGISKYVGNYAEGWVINPPSAEATFEACNRRHARSGVPFTLDMVKLKYLSPVRKQSPGWELDLESKLEHLAEIASWTDRSWFTYDYHQMSLLLANAVFDFEDARTFPYLFKTEGGCGGAPPYGNLDTVYSALFHYTRGRSRRGILGVMEEAVGVNTGAIKPRDTFFLRNSHLANMGDTSWLKFESAYRTLLSQGGIGRSEAEDLLREQEASVLPDYIKNLGVEIEPHAYTVGASISALRKEGLVMSEIDVKAALDAKEREMAILKDEPIGLLNKRLEEKATAFRSGHLKVLSQLSSVDPKIRDDLRLRGMLMPEDPGQMFRELCTSYYSMRTEEYARYSSLFYTDTIRVFKTSEIRELLESSNYAVRADFAATDSFPKKWVESFLEENSEERTKRERIHEWIDSAPLAELLYKPLPPGIGTDDDRIARSVIDIVEKIKDEPNCDMVITILFSGDRQLARITTNQVRGNTTKAYRLLQFDRSAYTRICLAGVQERNWLSANGRLRADEWLSIRQPLPRVSYYNYILKSNWLMPSSIIDQLLDTVRISSRIDRALVHVEYDFPNMERGLDLIRVNPSTGTMEEYGGGYLERRTLRSFGSNCWTKEELSEIYRWPDFEIVRSRRHYPWKGRVREDRILGFDPERPRSYSFVDSWRSMNTTDYSRRPESRRSDSAASKLLLRYDPVKGS
nr:putative RNA-dependent RNA polymerase [Leptosphaeria biglobosa narnavirus 14]